MRFMCVFSYDILWNINACNQLKAFADIVGKQSGDGGNCTNIADVVFILDRHGGPWSTIDA